MGERELTTEGLLAMRRARQALATLNNALGLREAGWTEVERAAWDKSTNLVKAVRLLRLLRAGDESTETLQSVTAFIDAMKT
jgi:hypothetical protein